MTKGHFNFYKSKTDSIRNEVSGILKYLFTSSQGHFIDKRPHIALKDQFR